MRGQGCPKCALLSPHRHKKDLHHFVTTANKIHHHKYDYSNTIYKSSNHPLVIICKKHGEFTQRASAHLRGQGCPKCARDKSHVSRKTNDQFIRDARKIHGDKYDYSKVKYVRAHGTIEIICKNHGSFTQRASSHLAGSGCPQCGTESMRSRLTHDTDKFAMRASAIHGDKYDYAHSHYVNSKSEVAITCPVHGTYMQKPNYHLLGNGCPKCAGTKLQQEVYDFINQFDENIIYNDSSTIRPYEIDIFVPSKNIGVETHGLYWHSYDHPESFDERMKHYNKCDLCNKQNIMLLQILENEWNQKQTIVKSIIANRLGHSKSIPARKCKVINIDRHMHRAFMNNSHIQGAKHCSIRLGLLYNNEIVAIMSFNRHPKYQWEITRFANKCGIRVMGGAGKLFNHFKKTICPTTILTYADRRYSNGNLYRKLGFEYSGVTKPNYSYVKHGEVFSRHQFQKHKLRGKLTSFDPALTESANMFINNYRRLWDAGHYRFIYTSA